MLIYIGTDTKKSRLDADMLEEVNTKVLPPKIRRTFYIRTDLDEKIRAYAYWERLGISGAVNMALDNFFKSVEVKRIPKNRNLLLKGGAKARMCDMIQKQRR